MGIKKTKGFIFKLDSKLNITKTQNHQLSHDEEIEEKRNKGEKKKKKHQVK